MNRAKKAAGKSTITQTHLLYAYNESPMLRQEHTSFRIPLQSKKVINFDREEELLKKDTEEDRKELEKLSPRTLPNDFNRKCTLC